MTPSPSARKIRVTFVGGEGKRVDKGHPTTFTVDLPEKHNLASLRNLCRAHFGKKDYHKQSSFTVEANAAATTPDGAAKRVGKQCSLKDIGDGTVLRCHYIYAKCGDASTFGRRNAAFGYYGRYGCYSPFFDW